MTIKDVDNVDSLVWGKIDQSVGPADLSIKGDINTIEPGSIGLDIKIHAMDTNIRLLGNVGALKTEVHLYRDQNGMARVLSHF